MVSNEMANNPFDGLTFADFQRLALDPSLSRHEKVGFPDNYREGQESLIFKDIVKKLGGLSSMRKTILEIGPGCSGLPVMLSELAEKKEHKVVFVDSKEMLDHLPDRPFITKINGQFPCGEEFIESFYGKFDVIIAYSVIQYPFVEGNIFSFLDSCLLLLAPGGEILFGDIPNITMRKRFFSSDAGITLHKEFTDSEEVPAVIFNKPEPGQIDDSVVLALVARARSQGYHAWIMPQADGITMSNRREDILLRRP